MKSKLTDEEKLDFITRNGWELYFKGPTQNLYIPPNAFCIGGMCENATLSGAYEIEMEAEYDRVTTLLKRAKGLLLNPASRKDSSEDWLGDYETWSNI